MKGVRKIRVSMTVDCGHFLTVGQVEVKTAEGKWICRPCALTRRLLKSPASAAASPG